MPEGDTLYRIAARLDPALRGYLVRDFELPRQQVATAQLLGTRITGVRALGKHLLIEIGETHVLHTHLKMTGIWHLYKRGARYRRPAALLVARIATDAWEAACFHAPLVRLLTAAQAKRDPMLRSIGPDVLSAEFDAAAAAAALAAASEPTLAEALLNQRYLAGIGNVYKSELLYAAGLDPFAAPQAFSADELIALASRAQALLLRNVASVGRGSAGAHYTYTRTTRSGCEAGKGPIAVYGRNGERCFRCDNTIERAYVGAFARSTYYCRSCQPARSTTTLPAPPAGVKG
jgi:endonuclease VIII